MPQCPSSPLPCGPRFIQVQQPPQIVNAKKVIYCNRTVVDRHVVSGQKEICEPKLIYQSRTIREPCIVYRTRVIQEPRIVYCKKIVTEPRIVSKQRTIQEPKEICQAIMCQPKPQTIQIPAAKEFICSPCLP